MKRITMKHSSFIFGILILTTGCVFSVEDEVDLKPDIVSDSDYYEAQKDATRSAIVYSDFETRSDVSVTYLSPEFRTALARRFELLFKDAQPILEEATSKAGFFVSVYSSEPDRGNLSDAYLWTLLLKQESSATKPVLIRKLTPKERWQPFFQYVSVWSTEYLVLFDSPSITPSDPKKVDKTSIELILANADADVTFTW